MNEGPEPASRTPVWLLGGAACLSVLALYAPWIFRPHIRFDDFNFLTRSRTWDAAWAHLWEPMNDHAMPLCRLAAALLMGLARSAAAIPYLTATQGPLAVILGMLLLYRFVRRELGHPFYGLAAMTLFGVTTAYYECVTWYSGSYFILSLDTFLLALLAAQSWRLTGKPIHLALCAFWCALAPGWFGGGILAGAWCSIYLLPIWRNEDYEEPRTESYSRFSFLVSHFTISRSWTDWAAVAVPMAGSVLFLAVSLPRTAERIIHAEHYHGKTVFQAFDLPEGITRTGRALVDSQVIGALGVHWPEPWPPWVAAVGLIGLAAIALAWAYLASHWRLLLLGAALIVMYDLLAYSARAAWPYEQVHGWTRYHLFPHLGLVLFLVGGLPRLAGRWLALDPAGGLTLRQAVALAALIGLSLACHLPRSAGSHFHSQEQMQVFRQIQEVDDRCREHRIDAATARAALGFLHMPYCYDSENAWDFLRGSPDPEPRSVAEARKLLQVE